MDEISLDCKEKMEKSLDNLTSGLATLRTGKASPAMLSHILVDYYGAPTPIIQISQITSPEPRQLLVKPYDKNDIKNIIIAISSSDLGLNPVSEGNVIRITIPPLTEDRRKEIVKQAKKYGEEAKIVVRNIRRDYMSLVKEDESMSEDYQALLEDEIQKVTDEVVKQIDQIVSEKESDILSI
ncbi:MAG: ribosome recycling factor [Coprobacillus sp.]|nr:ribosome recycling factor [Coprobacillus sp.]